MDKKNIVDFDRLKQLINDDSIKLISFDIFDTLLVRPSLVPTDAFYLIQENATKIAPQKLNNFYEIRLSAENEARKELSKSKSDYGEITIKQIYDYIGEKCFLTDSEKMLLISEEVKVEKQILQTRNHIKDIYDFALNSNKKVILVSDMYLEKADVENILKEKGINNYNSLYLSSDIKKRKDTGEAYKYIINKENIAASEILHIGDNYYSDVECALKEGINAFYIPSNYEIAFSEKSNQRKSYADLTKLSPTERILLGISVNKFAEDFLVHGIRNDAFIDCFYLGYNGLGPLVYSIAKNIISDSEIHNKYNCVHFASRDGYLPQKAYNCLRGENNKLLPSKYIYAGRQAYDIANYSGNVFKYLTTKSNHEGSYTVVDLFNALVKINFLDSKYSKEWLENSNLNVDESSGYPIIKQIVEEHYIEIKEILEAKKQLAAKYYSSEIEFNSDKRAIIFDVGYSGSVSKDIGKLSNGKIDKIYLWQTSKNELVDKEDGTKTKVMVGYLENKINYLPVDLLLEELLSSLEPACIGFEMKNEQKLVPSFNESEEYSSEMKNDLINIQNGALEYLSDMMAVLGVYETQLHTTDLDNLLMPFYTAFTNPADSSIRLLDNIKYPDAYSRSKLVSLSAKLEEFKPIKEIKVETQVNNDFSFYKNTFEKLIKEKRFFDAYMFLTQIPSVKGKENFVLDQKKYLIEKMQYEKKSKNWNMQKTIKSLNEAEKYINQGKYEPANENLLTILNYEYEQIEALINYSVLNILISDYKYALKIMEAILIIDPTNEITLANMKYVREQNINEQQATYDPIEEMKYESILCPFCKSADAEKFRTSADIVKCGKCDTIYLRRRLKKEEMYQLYQFYAENDSHMSLPKTNNDVLNSGLRRNNWMKEILEYTSRKGTLLDIGCGWGGFLDNARSYGFKPRGIEMTRKCVRFANEILNIEVSNDQFEDTYFDDNSVSVVTMNHVFEHLPYPLDALNKIYRILEVGGLFCGIVPNISSFVSGVLTEEWYWLDPNFHYVHYSPATLKNHLENAGFKIEKLYTVTGDYGIENVSTEIKKRFKINSKPEIEKLIASFEDKLIGEEIRFIARKII